MHQKSDIEKRCITILEKNGGNLAEEARTILLEDPSLSNLRSPLEFIATNWRDPLTPSLMSLSCQAVGGRPEQTREAALALSLMNLSFFIWDDIIDDVKTKLFKPTFFGKFGESTSIIMGGLISARAFSILNQSNIEKPKRQVVSGLCWNLWASMAQAEMGLLMQQVKNSFGSEKKLWKIKTEAIDIETCMRIGAVLGDGSQNEIENLGRYGRCLGIILELWKDFQISSNYTLELDEKIKNKTLPYSLLWAAERSRKLRETLDNWGKRVAGKFAIKKVVGYALETGTLDNVKAIIKENVEDASSHLSKIDKCPATQTLLSFLEDQLALFSESFSILMEQ